MNKLLKFLLSSWLTFGIVENDGGGDDDDGEAVGSMNDARLARLNEIGQSSEDTRSDEFGDTEIDDGVADKIIEEEEKEEAAAVALPKIKVNGVEIELTPEMVERAQKVAAADQYLAEASKLKREQEQQNSRPSVQDAANNVDEDDVALARALQMGSEEDAAAAIKAIRSKSPSLNRDEVVAAARDGLAMDEAVKWFQNEYKFIWKDPLMTKLALDLDADLLKKGDNRPYKERYETIGNQLTEWSGNLPKGGRTAKQELKEAAAENVVQIASKRADAAPVEDAEESTTDVIASMAKRRGQAI